MPLDVLGRGEVGELLSRGIRHHQILEFSKVFSCANEIFPVIRVHLPRDSSSGYETTKCGHEILRGERGSNVQVYALGSQANNNYNIALLQHRFPGVAFFQDDTGPAKSIPVRAKGGVGVVL